MNHEFDHQTIQPLRERLPKQRRSRRAVVAAMADAGRPITEETLYRWETGKNPPSAADLPALAVALDCQIGDFFSPVCPHGASTHRKSA